MGRSRPRGGSCSGVASRATADDGATPLFQAVFQSHPDMVELLLEHRADVEKAKHNGFTPLLTAAKITEILLEKGADINKAATLGQTPLFMAACSGHQEVVVTLLAAGADKEL